MFTCPVVVSGADGQTTQKTVEIPQVQFSEKVVGLLVCWAYPTTGAHCLVCAENRGGSEVAVHQHARCSTTSAHGRNCAETRGDSTGSVLG